MKIVSKEEAKKEFEQLTDKSFSGPNRKKQLDNITPDLENLSEGEVAFSNVEDEDSNSSVVKSFRDHLPEGFDLSQKKDEGNLKIAVYRKPESREVGAEIRRKLREEWGSLR